MRIHDLNEHVRLILEMSQSEAIGVFQKYGIDPTQMNSDQIKAAYRKLAFQHHPDRGGDLEAVKLINAANDVLKRGVKAGQSGRAYKRYYNRDEPSPGYPDGAAPIWAQAGHSGSYPESGRISRNDYTDKGFIQKRMWELNGKKTNETWYIQGHDGSFFRHGLSVYGNRALFPEMAKAMIQWQTQGANSYPIEYVFVSERSRPEIMSLIWAHGRSYAENPISFDKDQIGDPDLSQQANERKLIQYVEHRLQQIHESLVEAKK